MYSTVDDLAAWMMNYSTAAVGGPSVIEQMQQQGVLNDGEELSYAFGINVGELRGERVIRHTGSSAGFRASFTFFPDLEGGVVTLSNRSNVGGGVPAELIEVFFGDELDPLTEASAGGPPSGGTDPAPTPWAPSASQLSALEGTYYSAELQTVYTLFVEDGALMGSHRRHGTFELEPTDEMTFAGPGFFGTAVFGEGLGESGPSEGEGFRVSNGRVLNLLFRKVELR